MNKKINDKEWKWLIMIHFAVDLSELTNEKLPLYLFQLKNDNSNSWNCDKLVLYVQT